MGTRFGRGRHGPDGMDVPYLVYWTVPHTDEPVTGFKNGGDGMGGDRTFGLMGEGTGVCMCVRVSRGGRSRS